VIGKHRDVDTEQIEGVDMKVEILGELVTGLEEIGKLQRKLEGDN